MNEPALPQPTLARWQPLRLGLVELFRYDSEEFWFRDGHLLLRGNNGTGKSKVLSLTLPLLLDANLRSSRVEPDGDPGKRMAWNLLLGGAYERRTGYSWIEFGRRDENGQPHFVTLGLGLHAVAARTQVEAWYFIADGPLRIGPQGLALLSAQRQVPTRERLRELLAGQGQVFEQAQAYRRAVDERLFGLGPHRYGALLDTLIQLRQPQLSRRPDERALSDALTESLPPLAPELLGDVADALTQLEDLRAELERLQRLLQAVGSFDQRYRHYAGIASRRQARALRQAQTEFDNASRARHEADAGLAAARAAEVAAQARRDGATTLLQGARSRYETLLADPLNSDADRLQRAGSEARQRERERAEAQRDSDAAEARARTESALLDQATAADAAARETLAQARNDAGGLLAATGLQALMAEHAFVAADAQALVDAADASFDAARRALRDAPARRRDDLRLVRSRWRTLSEAEAHARPLQQALAERRADTEDAAAALAQAEEQAALQAEGHQQAWARHLDGLRELRPLATDALLEALASWVEKAEGEHPVLAALRSEQTGALTRLAQDRAHWEQQQRTLQDEADTLAAEAQALQSGIDSGPPAPAWRGNGTRAGRPGAALWQLVDFAPDMPAAQRAGLEAALQAAGLLDAWVTPTGAVLQAADGTPWLDAQWLTRPSRPSRPLGHWLRPDPAPDSGVTAETVQALLASIACGPADDDAAEGWVGLDGRFRLAGVAGAAAPTEARHIGHAAREAARQRRLAEIAQRLGDIGTQRMQLQRQAATLDARAQRIAQEWEQAPTDQALRRALGEVDAASRGLAQARGREAEAQARWQRADDAREAARANLARDAGDLRLPVEPAELDRVEQDLLACADALHQLEAAVRELRRHAPALALQRQRQADAQQQRLLRRQRLAERSVLAEQARTHAAALEEALGPQVHTLKQLIERARALVQRLEGSERRLAETLRLATEARAVAEQHQQQNQQRLEQAVQARHEAVEQLRRFAATGLLASGLAGRDEEPALPDPATPWTIDPALALARRVEQALAALADDDERWNRAQQQVSTDLQDLQRALSALGETAAATSTDFGFAVHVQWQQKALRPEALAQLLQADVQARQELLSAREREVLENHLQAEIASQIQALIRNAQAQVAAINRELDRRPTSTGVRFRLLWQALPETGAETGSAPAGLQAASERLLNTAADLWSAADRKTFGALLQRRIQDERHRADRSADGGAGAEAESLLEQLARALDYRRWHRFRVERWQDGSWRKLSGPASSGERALGLTVPLFAAVASFYGASPLAPRLMLLDEAFAGIDDAARAHCMGLVQKFDLDFVITSEREWGCYAELPGVAICQLQRREGIDAVHVSRWTWDGRTRRAEPAPPRAAAVDTAGTEGLLTDEPAA